MHASKENAREAKIHLTRLRPVLVETTMLRGRRRAVNARLRFLEEFLEVAQKKLPSEESYEREKGRRERKGVANLFK